MKKYSTWALAIGLLIGALSSRGVASAEDFSFTPPSLTALEIEQLAGLAIDRGELPALAPLAQGDPNLRTLWLGSAPTASAEVDEISLRLRQFVPEKKAVEYGVTLFFSDTNVVVRHSNPRDPEIRGGLRLKLAAQTWQRWIDGANDNHLYVLSPIAKSPGHQSILLCPRAQSTTQYEPEAVQEADRFEVISALYKGRASARGRITGSTGKSFAEAQILTTPQIPPAVTPKDSWEAQYPFVTVEYYPKVPFTVPDNAVALDGGMQAFALLRNSGGYQVRATATSTIRFATTTALELPKVGAGTGARHAQTGACLVVERRQEQVIGYDKKG